jgi:hypothetical protein
VLPPNTNVEHKYSQSRIVTEELRWVHGGKGQVAQQERVKTIMTGPDTGFSQPIKFQVMGTTIYNCNRGIKMGPWREGPSSTTGQGENHHDWPRHWVFTANKVPSNGCYHPTPMWNTIYSQSIIVTEELRWVHGEKGHVAQQDRMKTTMTANKVPRNGCCHPTPMWNTNIANLES